MQISDKTMPIITTAECVFIRRKMLPCYRYLRKIIYRQAGYLWLLAKACILGHWIGIKNLFNLLKLKLYAYY